MSYTITLVGCKGDEIELISMVMELCSLDMNGASKVVDHMPSVIFENIDEASANKYKKILEGVGAILKIDEAEAGAGAATSPVDAFPEPDFGKVLGGMASNEAVASPEPVRAPEPIASPEPEPVSEPDPEPEPSQTSNRQSVIEITSRSNDVSQDVTENENKADSSQVSSSQAQSSANNDSSSSESEAPKYEYYGYCPKCGSSFVTVKKVGGLFGSNKVKCVCEACGHKF